MHFLSEKFKTVYHRDIRPKIFRQKTLPYGRMIYTGLMGLAKKQSQPRRTPQADIQFY